MKVSHLTKTRHAHRVTVMSLAKLQQDAFKALSNTNIETTFEKWKEEMTKNNPTFEFWDKILQLELLMLIFVPSHRERNFDLYIHAMEALAPWFFTLDHTNYARWLAVHIRNMKPFLMK